MTRIIILRVNSEFLNKIWNLNSIRYHSNALPKAKMLNNNVYKNLYPWKSREEFAVELSKRVVYNQSGLIAINKPYGVGVRDPANEQKKDGIIMSGFGECEYKISEILPIFQNLMQIKSPLNFIKATDRFSSGLVLLASSEHELNRVKNCMNRAKAALFPLLTFRAIVTNVPFISKPIKERVGIKLLEIPDIKQKVAVIETNISKKALKEKRIRSSRVELQLLSVNNIYNAALVEISTTINSWHFARVYLAHKLAPILGDTMYSSRVKTVSGKAIAVSPYNAICYEPPILDAKLCQVLGVPKEKTLNIPAHLHLKSITLMKYEGEKNLVINADPDERFLWTMKTLDLKSDDAISNQVTN